MKPERFSWRPTGGYIPTSPYTGDNPNYIFRGLNQILKGNGESLYCESWRGSEDISETVTYTTLTGTVATTANSQTVTGTSTLFTEQLIIGQPILISNQLYQVRAIASNTSMTITPAAGATGSGITAYAPHILTDVDISRGNLARGSILRFPQGTILAVGSGQVLINGSALSGGGMTADKRLQIGVYDPSTGNYTVDKLGMKTPVLTTVAAQAGGTKNMQGGTYSVRIVPARLATGGWNNPSEKVEVTIATGEKIRITFPAMDTTAGQDAWDIYATLYSTGQGIQGPWYFVERINAAHVSTAGGTYDIEYNDADISGNRLLEFNNDPPPDAGFVASFQGFPVLLSCNGPGRVLAGTAATTASDATITGTSTTFTQDVAVGQLIYIGSGLYEVLEVTSNTAIEVSPTPTANASGLTVRLADTTPGPVVRPSKPNNPEAFPASYAVAVSPPENIIGYVEGGGRIFLMTENRLHMAVLSGVSVSPVTVRPFWRAGFRNSQALVFVNGYLYGYTQNGATRSIADGDEGAQEHEFAAPVAADMRSWLPERVRVGYDPVNEAVCYFHSNDNVNGSGYYQTKVLMFMLQTQRWSPPIVIESNSAHMTVTGVATVSGNLYFTANQKNWRWDSGTNTVSGYLASPFLNLAQDGRDMTVRGVGMTGYSASSVNAGIWAAQVLEDLPISDLVNGTSPDSGAVAFAQGSGARQSLWQKLNVRRSRLAAIRVNLDSSSGNLSRLDEVFIDVSARSVKY